MPRFVKISEWKFIVLKERSIQGKCSPAVTFFPVEDPEKEIPDLVFMSRRSSKLKFIDSNRYRRTTTIDKIVYFLPAFMISGEK